jgi:hypothetical protein
LKTIRMSGLNHLADADQLPGDPFDRSARRAARRALIATALIIVIVAAIIWVSRRLH